ncbi:unnamed protein product [Phytophthora fragariaefolia]|uniref:Unnamed protein product n=1 Tax=Phytophthora fragariaefolia TaxID=1490495 RepID=A0A9W6XTG3_9STRA|nr:unnamed protein product [Phytophthora fragariaefolia]
MSSTSESGAGSAGPSAYHVMEKDLKPWELYDLSGAEGPENLDAMKELRSPSRDRGRLGEGGYAAPTYLQPVNNQASGHDNVSCGADVETRDYSWQSGDSEGEPRGWRGHRDQPSAPRSIGVPPRHPPAAGAHHAGTGVGALSLGSEMSVASERSTPLGSEPAGASELPTPEQYRLMMMETDQARDDTMEAQPSLRASAPRQQGRSDYAPAADTPAADAATVDAATAGALAATDQPSAQGSSQGHTA